MGRIGSNLSMEIMEIVTTEDLDERCAKMRVE